MTTLLEKLGLNRDSIALVWGKWIGFVSSVVLMLAPMGMDVTKYGIPAKWVPFIQLAAVVIAMESAQHRTSDLPGKHDSDLIIQPGSLPDPKRAAALAMPALDEPKPEPPHLSS